MATTTRTLDSFDRGTVDRANEWLAEQLGDREIPEAEYQAQLLAACLEIEAIDEAADAAQVRAERPARRLM